MRVGVEVLYLDVIHRVPVTQRRSTEAPFHRFPPQHLGSAAHVVVLDDAASPPVSAAAVGNCWERNKISSCINIVCCYENYRSILHEQKGRPM